MSNPKRQFIRTAILNPNEVLQDSEIVKDTTTGRPPRLYVGDGRTKVRNLPYFTASTESAGSVTSDQVSNATFLPGDTVSEVFMNMRPIRITQTDAANIGGSGVLVPKAGQQVQITNNGRVYIGDGVNNIAALVAADNYLVPNSEN
jgi:hypothetical protein